VISPPGELRSTRNFGITLSKRRGFCEVLCHVDAMVQRLASEVRRCSVDPEIPYVYMTRMFGIMKSYMLWVIVPCQLLSINILEECSSQRLTFYS
jgi:hypothetical protein